MKFTYLLFKNNSFPVYPKFKTNILDQIYIKEIKLKFSEQELEDIKILSHLNFKFTDYKINYYLFKDLQLFKIIDILITKENDIHVALCM